MALEHVLGGLDDAEGRLFRAHLVSCAHCRARVGELRSIAHDLADAERDEERQRAARSLETKRRVQTAERAVGPRRPRSAPNPRLLVGLLLGLVVAMGVWVFFLRGTITELEGHLEAALEASRTLEAGRSWDVQVTGGLDVRVREDQESLVVLVEGLDDGAYTLDLTDGEGQVIESHDATPVDGRVFVMLREPPDTAQRLSLRPEAPDAVPLVEATAQ